MLGSNSVLAACSWMFMDVMGLIWGGMGPLGGRGRKGGLEV